MSNTLMTMGQGPLTMSTREIAQLLGKTHSNIKISAERLAATGVIGTLASQEFEHNGNGYIEYLLNKRDSLILVAQNCPEFTAAVVDRWQELESSQKPVELSRMDILQIAMQAEQERITAIAQRDEAVRTKAEIGSRREATAMATASAKSKEVAKLQHELGRNQQHATVIAVEKATKQKFAKNAYVGLRKAAKEFGLSAVDVVDQRYGSVKAWPAAAWRKCFGIDLGDLFPGEVA